MVLLWFSPELRLHWLPVTGLHNPQTKTKTLPSAHCVSDRHVVIVGAFLCVDESVGFLPRRIRRLCGLNYCCFEGIDGVSVLNQINADLDGRRGGRFGISLVLALAL